MTAMSLDTKNASVLSEFKDIKPSRLAVVEVQKKFERSPFSQNKTVREKQKSFLSDSVLKRVRDSSTSVNDDEEKIKGKRKDYIVI